MDKKLFKIIGFFQERLYFKVFLLLLVNLLIIALIAWSVSRLFSLNSFERNLAHTDLMLKERTINYWEDYFENYIEKYHELPNFQNNSFTTEDAIELIDELELRHYPFALRLRDIEKLMLLNIDRRPLFQFGLVLAQYDFHQNSQNLKRRRGPFELRIDAKKNDDDDDDDDDDQYLLPLFALPVKNEIYPILVEDTVVAFVRIPKFSNSDTSSSSKILLTFFSSLAAIILLVLASTGLIAFFITNWLLHPIAKIKQGLIAIENKQFDYRLRLKKTDEIGQLAKSFNKMAEQMEEFVAEKKMWMASISHELRTPLTILLGEVEAMIDGVRSSSKEQLQSLQFELTTLKEMITDLQEIASIDRELGLSNMEPAAADALISEIVSRMKEPFAKRGLQLEMQGNASCELMVNKNLFRRAVLSVLENCLNYSSNGKVLVSTSLIAGKFKLSIEDTGPGVSFHEIKHLFDYFYRAESSTNLSGNGLGLAICKTIVEGHGGEVRAERSSIAGLKIIISLNSHDK